MKHLEEHNTCPTCDIVIHQSHPLNYISYDRTMQDIVYKLVSNLQSSMSYGTHPNHGANQSIFLIRNQAKRSAKRTFTKSEGCRIPKRTTRRMRRMVVVFFPASITSRKPSRRPPMGPVQTADMQRRPVTITAPMNKSTSCWKARTAPSSQ